MITITMQNVPIASASGARWNSEFFHIGEFNPWLVFGDFDPGDYVANDRVLRVSQQACDRPFGLSGGWLMVPPDLMNNETSATFFSIDRRCRVDVFTTKASMIARRSVETNSWDDALHLFQCNPYLFEVVPPPSPGAA